MIKRATSWGSPSHLADGLVGDLCKTPGCNSVPDYVGALYCFRCATAREQDEQDGLEARYDAHIDRLAEAERDER